MMELGHKRVMHILFFSYVIACYCSRIPAHFIEWQIVPDGSPSGLSEEGVK